MGLSLIPFPPFLYLLFCFPLLPFLPSLETLVLYFSWLTHSEGQLDWLVVGPLQTRLLFPSGGTQASVHVFLWGLVPTCRLLLYSSHSLCSPPHLTSPTVSPLRDLAWEEKIKPLACCSGYCELKFFEEAKSILKILKTAWFWLTITLWLWRDVV